MRDCITRLPLAMQQSFNLDKITIYLNEYEFYILHGFLAHFSCRHAIFSIVI